MRKRSTKKRLSRVLPLVGCLFWQSYTFVCLLGNSACWIIRLARYISWPNKSVCRIDYACGCQIRLLYGRFLRFCGKPTARFSRSVLVKLHLNHLENGVVPSSSSCATAVKYPSFSSDGPDNSLPVTAQQTRSSTAFSNGPLGHR